MNPERADGNNSEKRDGTTSESGPAFKPITALEALAEWDAGNPIFTVEMGGIGPGYEQTIQILVFELIRDCSNRPLPDDDPLPDDAWRDWGRDTISRLSPRHGFSGAQVGAAKSVAFRALRDGWHEMLESAPGDRLIIVSRTFPVAPLADGNYPKQ